MFVAEKYDCLNFQNIQQPHIKCFDKFEKHQREYSL